MQTIRQLLTAFSYTIALWVVASVVGVMADPARAGFWSGSLMWGVLATLVIAPALIVMYDPSFETAENDEVGPSASPTDSQKPFVDESRTEHVAQESSSSQEEESLPEWVREQTE